MKIKLLSVFFLITFFMSDCSESVITNEKSQKEEKYYVLIISIPKSGSHCLGNLLSALENKHFETRGHERDHNNILPMITEIKAWDKRNVISYVHMPYKTSEADLFVAHNIKIFFIYRDPRDQLLSAINHFKDADRHIKTLNDKIYYYINTRSYNAFGKDIQPGVYGLYASFMPWAFDERVCAVRYEDLVGEEGGGSEEQQTETIQRVAAHLGKTLTDEEVELVAKKIYGGTRTFYKGQIGRWRELFAAGHKKAFKENSAGQLLVALGYEENENW